METMPAAVAEGFGVSLRTARKEMYSLRKQRLTGDEIATRLDHCLLYSIAK